MADRIRGDARLHLRTIFNVGATGTLSDGQLLERFATGRGEPRELAFAALVERHGPFVQRVCRSVLRDDNAADDAFQATFLALARKAESLWARNSLAPWLHQAAYRAAVHDRSAIFRRRAHEQAAAALRPEPVAPPHQGNVDDLEKIVHEEIDRLPGRFRVAVVLCDLEGRTHEQAALHLGCAVGTVKSRLARGRTKLRGRLVRRGVAPALAVAFAGGAARAAVPAGLAESTVIYAATASAIPTSVAVITEGVLISMFPSKVKLVMTATAIVAALAAGAVALAQSGIGRPKEGAGELQHVGLSSGTSPILVGRKDPYRPKIVLTRPKVMDVAITEPYVCQIHARRHISIRALEEGFLDEIAVKEGQTVKKGDLMFKIVPFQADAKPDPKLFNIMAPFDGLIGRLHEQPGSMAKEGDILTELSDNSILWVYFNVPEKSYLEFMANRKQREEEDKFELVLANQKKFSQPGKLGAIEAKFNNETGTVAFRADFPNPERLLRHGQTGTILMHRKVHDAIVIPMRATYEIKDKRYVYVVDKDDVAHRREIVPQHEVDDIYVIKKGVGAGERIVLEGIRQVRDGEKVEYEFRPPDEVMRKL